MKSCGGITDTGNPLETWAGFPTGKSWTESYTWSYEAMRPVYYISGKWVTEIPIKQWAIDDIRRQPFF